MEFFADRPGNYCPGSGKKVQVSLLREPLAEEAKDCSLALRGQSQGIQAQLLARLQCQEIGALLVQVGERKFAGSAFERVDQILGEIEACLQDRAVRTKRRRISSKRNQGARNRGQGGIDIGIGAKIIPRDCQVNTGRRRRGVEPGNGQVRCVVLVERDFEVVRRRLQQVNAVESRIIRESVDLTEQLVELHRERRALVGITGRLRVTRETLGLLNQIGNRIDTIDRRLDRADRKVDTALETIEIGGPVIQRPRRKERCRIVECRINFETRRQTRLRLVDRICGPLQRQKIAANRL